MFYSLDKLKPNTENKKLNPKMILLFLEFFIKNLIVILAFFETIWLKYDVYEKSAF